MQKHCEDHAQARRSPESSHSKCPRSHFDFESGVARCNESIKRVQGFRADFLFCMDVSSAKSILRISATFILLSIVSPYSTGGGHCIAPFSYTHGNQPSNADVALHGFTVVSEGGSIIVSGNHSFKGLLLYTNQGNFENLPSNLQFKTSCDSMRGAYRTVTHLDSTSKTRVAVPLRFPEPHFEAVVVNAIIVRSIREWFWLNISFADMSANVPPLWG